MTELMIELVSVVLQIALVAIAGLLTKHALPWLNDVVVPWLQERHLYNTICYFVQAAEKLANTGKIDKETKKSYVIKLLEGKGIKVTDSVDAMIESAVLDLDIAFDSVVDIVTKPFEGEQSADGNDEISEQE